MLQQKITTIEEAAAALSTLKSEAKINVERCGKWLWIDGETRQVKESLKAIGCLWNPKKEKWFWRSKEDGKRRYFGRNTAMYKIRARYGSEEVA